MRTYFAYGSNMDPAQMADRCPGAARLGPGWLPDRRFIIAAHGYASHVRDAGRAVHGILWTLTPQDESVLDEYEGVRPGLYVKERALISRPNTSPVRAFLYRATADSVRGVPTREYMSNIVETAGRLGFPADYVSELRRWMP